MLLMSWLRGCLAKEISSLNFHHSSLNFSHLFGIITQFPSLNIFHTICGPHTSQPVQLFLYFFCFFFCFVFSTQTHRSYINNKKIKKSKGGQKLRLWVPHVCLFTEILLSYEWWKQSYGNRVIVWPNNLFTMDPTIFELWVMETENWVINKLNPNGPLCSYPLLNLDQLLQTLTRVHKQ